MLSINSIVVVRRLGSSIAYLEPRTKELQTKMVLTLFFSAAGHCQIKERQPSNPGQYSARSVI